MTSIANCIHALEAYVERSGASVHRALLPKYVHGRVYCDRITLRADLSPKQELVALLHELAHWLAHRDARCDMDCTLFEYEAEAVEAVVMARLGLPHSPVDCGVYSPASPTDNLLSASVGRVLFASGRICAALGIDAEPQGSEAQAAIQLQAAPGEEVVFEYEQHGMGDFVRLSETL
ncbi:MAG TPA: hypothetical protein VKG63_07215 [Steroidobacteraceae bacterium]|nr:hypothetical protein [Steroidobacteraceae bacterium]